MIGLWKCLFSYLPIMGKAAFPSNWMFLGHRFGHHLLFCHLLLVLAMANAVQGGYMNRGEKSRGFLAKQLTAQEYMTLTGQAAAIAQVEDHLSRGSSIRSTSLSSQTIPSLVSLLVADEIVTRTLIARTLKEIGWKPERRAERASYYLAMKQWEMMREEAPIAVPLTEEQDERANTFEGAIDFGTSITAPLRMLSPVLTFGKNEKGIRTDIHLEGYGAIIAGSSKFRLLLDILDETGQVIEKREDIFESRYDWSSMIGYAIPHESNYWFPMQEHINRAKRFRIRAERFYGGAPKPFTNGDPSKFGVQGALEYNVPIFLDVQDIILHKHKNTPPSPNRMPPSWIIFHRTPDGIAARIEIAFPSSASYQAFAWLIDEDGYRVSGALSAGIGLEQGIGKEPYWRNQIVRGILYPTESFARVDGFLISISMVRQVAQNP